MDRLAHYDWPFFEERHAKLAIEADAWGPANLAHAHGADADAICKRLVQDLGCAGFLHHCVSERPDVRSIALLREVFAYHAGLADFAFAMAGLSTIPISLAGTAEQKERYLRRAAAGEAIGAFALSEPEAGSDVQALKTRASRDSGGWRLDGEKTWISNGGIAHFYVVFARAEEGISAFIVEAPEVDASQRIDIVAPHPMATVRMKDARAEPLGGPGQGFKLAMRGLDIFRTTVAGAALGFARRALDESLARARSRSMFGQTLADFQMTQAKLADMATGIGGAAHVSLGVEEGHGRRARDARGRDGEDVRHRVGAARGRRGGADLRRARGDARAPGGEALPRGSRAAHLRGCDRSPEDRHREGPPEMTRYTAHVDTFARDNLPPTAAWPELLFELPELQYAGRLNCATELLDKPVTRGYGHRIALRTPDGECSYTQLFTQANRIANVLVRSMGLKPGNRVLLRGPNNPMMAACWFAVMKAGGICVATMPLLRAKELTEIIQKAEVSHALCDKRLEAELSSAAAACPTLKQLSY